MPSPIFSNYDICGDCLHSISCHTEYNGIGKFMYCSACFKLCDRDLFLIKHESTSINIIMEIGARKQ